jgi:hypothetical protein
MEIPEALCMRNCYTKINAFYGSQRTAESVEAFNHSAANFYMEKATKKAIENNPSTKKMFEDPISKLNLDE